MHTVKDVEAELRLILAGTAEWLCHFMDAERVAEALGLDLSKLEPDDRLGTDDNGVVKPDWVKIDGTLIWSNLRRIHEYVLGNAPYEEGRHILSEISDVALFFGFLRVHDLPPNSAMEYIHPSEQFKFKRACMDTLNAALARYKLDSREEDLSLREVALLGDLNEQTVRNAASRKGEGALSTYLGPSGQMVHLEDAVKWLAGRRGFRPTPDAWYQTQASLETCVTAEMLGKYVANRRESLSLSVEQLARRSKVRVDDLRALERGDIAVDLPKLNNVATALGEIPRKFSSRAVECFFNSLESSVARES
jgi:hypothetical protein